MDDPLSKISIDEAGNKCHWLNGRVHRTDGPAIENSSGDRGWKLNGEWHREDGPAVEYINGTVAWYLNHELLSFDEWLKRTPGLTDEEKVMYKLQYG
jgi:hypothetical protein